MRVGLRQALVVLSCAMTASGVIAATDDASLEEIVVTAQKRAEKLLDVPASVSAISGDRLQSLQVNSLSDLANYVSGLSVSAGGAPGFRTIVLRGLSTSYSNATTGPLVGTYVDDLPVGNSTAGARGAMYGLDLNPYDVDRVEVIKGPQGTLYGANTMGGLVKYVLRKPDLANVGVQMGIDSEDTDGSGKPSWGTHGAVNLPILTDTLAVRISGFFKNDAGYVDNAALGTQDVNHSTESGGLATLLWQATDRLAVRAAILTQDIGPKPG
jgi:iron complex outermembrane receptor protein